MQQTLLPSTLDPVLVAGASATGGALYLGNKHIFAIHAIWPAGITGNIGLECSIDGANWEAIPDAEQAVSGAGSYMWNYTAAGFVFVRPYFTWASGSGTIIVKANDKGTR